MFDNNLINIIIKLSLFKSIPASGAVKTQDQVINIGLAERIQFLYKSVKACRYRKDDFILLPFICHCKRRIYNERAAVIILNFSILFLGKSVLNLTFLFVILGIKYKTEFSALTFGRLCPELNPVYSRTAAGIAGKVVETMTNAFGTDPADLRCAIGRNVGICHFETDADVPEAMLAAFGDEVSAYISKVGEKYHLDLKAINAMVLRRAGVTHIEISGECTMCQSQRFWSHRVTQGIRGSQGAVIVCQEVRR